MDQSVTPSPFQKGLDLIMEGQQKLESEIRTLKAELEKKSEEINKLKDDEKGEKMENTIERATFETIWVEDESQDFVPPEICFPQPSTSGSNNQQPIHAIRAKAPPVFRCFACGRERQRGSQLCTKCRNKYNSLVNSGDIMYIGRFSCNKHPNSTPAYGGRCRFCRQCNIRKYWDIRRRRAQAQTKPAE